MECEECKDLLSWYLESEIQSKEIEKHLSICSRCSNDLELLKRILVQVRKLPQVIPPDQICSQIVEKIKTELLPKKVIYIYQTQDEREQKLFVIKNKEQISTERKPGTHNSIKSRTFKKSDGTKRRFIELCFS